MAASQSTWYAALWWRQPRPPRCAVRALAAVRVCSAQPRCRRGRLLVAGSVNFDLRQHRTTSWSRKSERTLAPAAAASAAADAAAAEGVVLAVDGICGINTGTLRREHHDEPWINQTLTVPLHRNFLIWKPFVVNIESTSSSTLRRRETSTSVSSVSTSALVRLYSVHYSRLFLIEILFTFNMDMHSLC